MSIMSGSIMALNAGSTDLGSITSALYRKSDCDNASARSTMTARSSGAVPSKARSRSEYRRAVAVAQEPNTQARVPESTKARRMSRIIASSVWVRSIAFVTPTAFATPPASGRHQPGNPEWLRQLPTRLWPHRCDWSWRAHHDIDAKPANRPATAPVDWQYESNPGRPSGLRPPERQRSDE